MEVCDVDADGDCFYNCVLTCLRDDTALWDALSLPSDLQEAITQVRETIAGYVQTDKEVSCKTL